MTSAAHIRAGGMRHRAELQSKARIPDGGGGSSVAWATERQLWCQIRPLSGGMRLHGMQRQSSVSHEIYARYAADVDPGVVTGKRILHDGNAYRIEAAWLPGEVKEYVHMVATRGVAT